MDFPNLWALVDFTDNTVISVFGDFELAHNAYLSLASQELPVFRKDGKTVVSSSLGVLYYCPQGVCPFSEHADKIAKEQ